MIAIWLFVILYDSSSFVHYLWLLVGGLQTGTAIYERKKQYLTIENGRITKHSIFSKTIDVDKIQKIRKFVGSYKIETEARTLKINKGIIEDESLYKLEDYLNSLEIKV